MFYVFSPHNPRMRQSEEEEKEDNEEEEEDVRNRRRKRRYMDQISKEQRAAYQNSLTPAGSKNLINQIKGLSVNTAETHRNVLYELWVRIAGEGLKSSRR